MLVKVEKSCLTTDFTEIQILRDVHDLNFFHEHVILLFYAGNELLSVETKIYECFAFLMSF